jgi:hypothetical protein
VVWRTKRSRETRKSQKVQGPQRKQEIADEYSCMTAAVPVKRGFGTGFVPLGFPVHCALVRVSRFTREGTEERNLTMFCLE